MSIRERLTSDIKSAMKSRDSIRLGCLRMLKARLQEKEVAARGSQGVGYELNDEDALQVISTYAKQRRDSIQAYREGGRDDLVDKEQAELLIVEEYLPRQLGADELREFVREAIAESGASSPKDMGAVMKAVMPKTQGRADGKQVSQIVRELLSASPEDQAAQT